jgi:hypothetical protein
VEGRLGEYLIFMMDGGGSVEACQIRRLTGRRRFLVALLDLEREVANLWMDSRGRGGCRERRLARSCSCTVMQEEGGWWRGG